MESLDNVSRHLGRANRNERLWNALREIKTLIGIRL
jgi:hypothetical protein